MIKCEFEFCENEAEYYDLMDSKICTQCMEMEINDYNSDPEDYEIIKE